MEHLAEALGLTQTLELLSLSPPGWGGNLLRGLANSLKIAFGAFGFGLVLGLLGASGALHALGILLVIGGTALLSLGGGEKLAPVAVPTPEPVPVPVEVEASEG